MGKYTDLAALWTHIDDLYDAIDWADRSISAARTVHDVLLLMLCLREHPIVRPGCLRVLLAPGVTAPCPSCSLPGCPGNSWNGATAVIRHFKTERSHVVHHIVVAPGSKSARLLGEYTSWARAALATADTPYMFLSARGDAFSPSAWCKYLPRLLSDVADVGWTRVRGLLWACIRPA